MYMYAYVYPCVCICIGMYIVYCLLHAAHCMLHAARCMLHHTGPELGLRASTKNNAMIVVEGFFEAY